jgi:hypothetical protein
VILYRAFAWNRHASHDRPDGPLWFPRTLQGAGRHDNPDDYGCLYASELAVSPVVEQLAPFRGRALLPEMLVRRGLPLALATVELDAPGALIDLDDPSTLAAHELRPSRVVTRRREVTQPQALALYRRHRRAAGLRWWSSFEALWANVTLFDRAVSSLRIEAVRALATDDPAVVEAAELLGLA